MQLKKDIDLLRKQLESLIENRDMDNDRKEIQEMSCRLDLLIASFYNSGQAVGHRSGNNET
jgi:hypothetical protein